MRTPGETTIKFIEMLLNESVALLIRNGETRADAERLARGFVLSYSQKTSGQTLYFRKDLKFDAQSKRNAIRADFWAGSTVFELSDKYKLSTVRIYQIIKQKETELTETDTSLKAPLMIEAVRVLLKAGIEKEDAINAARGLIAVVLARFNGILLSMPKQDKIDTVIRNIEIVRYHQAGKSLANIAAHFRLSAEEIRNIVKNYPTAAMPDASELPKIKTHLFNMASSFSDHPEIKFLLETAGDTVMQAQKAIKKGIPELNK
jgi:Mor family transcriptional regulator